MWDQAPDRRRLWPVGCPQDSKAGIGVSSAQVQQLHLRSLRPGRVAGVLSHPDGSDGVHRGVLDSTVSDSGRAWLQGVSGQRAFAEDRPGRKSDVSDCEWIQYLHSVGLLKASFRPPEDICAVRTLWRHRGSLLQMAAEHTQHIQKSLSLMNLQLHHVLSDITGASGLAILDAILAGDRDPVCLAHLCNIRVKSPRETVAQALVGDYRPEHLFTLKQSLDGYRYYHKLIPELEH